MLQEEETQPLIASNEHYSKRNFKSVYYYFFILFIGCFGTALVSQANIDAEYYIICKWAGIDENVCLIDPRTSDYESILSSYVDVIGGILSSVSLFFVSHFVNVFGMKAVVISACIFSSLFSVGYWLLLEAPGVHYLWVIVPEIFSCWTFASLAQVLSSIYVSEQITDATYRTMFLGWMEAVLSGPQIFGPGTGATILRWFGLSNLFLVSAAFSVVGIVASIFYLQESHKVDRDASNEEQKSSIFDSAKLMTLNFIEDPSRRTTARKFVFLTVAISAFSNLGNFLQSIYVKKRFGWSAIENGYLSSTSQAIRACSVAIISPIVVTALGKRYRRHDRDYDIVDAIMANFLMICLLASSVLKAMFPFPKAYFGFESLQQFESISQSTLLSIVFKFSPEGKNSSFWVGIVYLVQITMIPSVLLALNIYRKVLRTFPESLFWTLALIWIALLIFSSSIRTKT